MVQLLQTRARSWAPVQKQVRCNNLESLIVLFHALLLSLVYRIDRDMHGNRSTESEFNSGARVSVRSWCTEFFDLFVSSVTWLLQIMLVKETLLFISGVSSQL
jgi:hypothetical protein